MKRKSDKLSDKLRIKGKYTFECFDKDGRLKWREDTDNLVVTVGRNALLDAALAGSSYTAAAYMGLISSVDWSAIAAGDAMGSHSGWKEAGPTNAPNYTGDRKTCAWAAAASGAKALSASLSFAPNESGTLKGGFIVFGTGASATKDSTGGVLLSAVAFTEGDRSVVSGDTINVSYTLTLS
ncbi:MAG: hypothetical protein CVV44_03905 [Spirochaetae bacterium HGW-Spirochaetae-1]|nr:MAG: hypothetical protein CVV44_03905 [Spirochaetae bacterium HGW-Spirochaetae-1]